LTNRWRCATRSAGGPGLLARNPDECRDRDLLGIGPREESGLGRGAGAASGRKLTPTVRYRAATDAGSNAIPLPLATSSSGCSAKGSDMSIGGGES